MNHSENFCLDFFRNLRWVIPPKHIFQAFPKLLSINSYWFSFHKWRSMIFQNRPWFWFRKWHSRACDYVQLWSSIPFYLMTSYHARTFLLAVPVLHSIRNIWNFHLWRHKWRKNDFLIFFCKWRWLITPKYCHGLNLKNGLNYFFMIAFNIMLRIHCFNNKDNNTECVDLELSY